MKNKLNLALLSTLVMLSTTVRSAEMTDITATAAATADSVDTENSMDELNPFDANIQDTLKEMDADYEAQTGQSPRLKRSFMNFFAFSSCYRLTCSVYISIDKSQQRAFVYINGQQRYEWLVSTGTAGRGTPNFDKHPNGRIYDRYTSTKFPGGDYDGLGNMPYAVFIEGGFAIHGTGRGNWPKLGRPASHGCIRLHPDNGYIFNRLVRQYGVQDTWITVQ